MNEEKVCPFKAFFEAHAPMLLPHRGKIAGMIAGVVLAFAVLIFGFWQTFFVLFCGFVGLLIGIRIDHGIRLYDVKEFFREMFPYRYKCRRYR